jgi:ribosomal-protein-alanine N-acetyltransferase
MLSIETDRLILRDLQLDDEPAMAALRMDPVVTRYIDYILSRTPAEVHEWLLGTLDHNSRVPRLSWNLTILRKADGPTLGWIGIGRGSHPQRGDLDFGYALLPEHWRQGYAAEALHALIDWCFSNLAIQRVYGECDIANLRSARVMLNAGLLTDPTPGPEGDLRFAVSREEWEAAERSSV